MFGTEKQVKWATEIRANVIKTFEAVINDFAPMASDNEMIRKNIADIQARIDILSAENILAGDIITLFKDIRFGADYRENFERVISVYRVANPATGGQHTILMK